MEHRTTEEVKEARELNRDEKGKSGRRDKDRKTAIQTDTWEKTGIGMEGETNRKNKLRQPHSGETGKE